MPSSRLARFLLPLLVFVVLAVVVALFAGYKYGIVAFLIGLVLAGGLAAGVVVAEAEDAPFATDDATAAGDSSQHSGISSAGSSTR